MYDSSLVKGCLYPVSWLTELTNGESGVWLTVNQVYGSAMDVEISGIYNGYDSGKPSTNFIHVRLYEQGLDGSADYEFHMTHKSPNELLELGRALYSLFTKNRAIKDVIIFCRQQGMDCGLDKIKIANLFMQNSN